MRYFVVFLVLVSFGVMSGCTWFEKREQKEDPMEKSLQDLRSQLSQFYDLTGDSYLLIAYEYYNLARQFEQENDREKAEVYYQRAKIFHTTYENFKQAAQMQGIAVAEPAARPPLSQTYPPGGLAATPTPSLYPSGAAAMGPDGARQFFLTPTPTPVSPPAVLAPGIQIGTTPQAGTPLPSPGSLQQGFQQPRLRATPTPYPQRMPTPLSAPQSTPMSLRVQPTPIPTLTPYPTPAYLVPIPTSRPHTIQEY